MNRNNEEFEWEMELALQRVEAPEGLADRVMRRAEEEPGSAGRRIAARVLGFPARQVWIGSVAASLLVGALVFGGVEHRREEERLKAERNFARSLEITDRAMDLTRERLQKAGVVMD